MSPSRARYVTLCQQLLALGVVVIALVPATRVISLDVVGEQPGTRAGQPTIAQPDSARARAHLGRTPLSPRVAERGGASLWVGRVPRPAWAPGWSRSGSAPATRTKEPLVASG